MALTMLYYYNLKEIIKTLPENITQNMDLSNDNIFNYATFNDLGRFYTFNLIRKDKYRLNIKLEDEHFYDYLKEAIFIFAKDANPNQLLLIYAMLAHYILYTELKSFLKYKITKKDSEDKLTQIIDTVYTRIYDNIDLSKKTIYSLFPHGFTYTKEMNDLVNPPFIKIHSFLGTHNYYTRCMKNKRKFYKHYTQHTLMRYILHFFYDLIFNHSYKHKARYYRYPKKYSTDVLYLDKSVIDNPNITSNYSLDDVINLARMKTLNQIKIINDYLFEKKDKEFNILFKIEKE